MRKIWISAPIVVAGFLGLGVVAGPSLVGMIEEAPVMDTTHAQWASTANTVAEQVRQADLVVRVRATGEQHVRAHIAPLPADALKGDTPPGLVIPFTDTGFEVIDVFKGQAGDTITVMQTGGAVERTAAHAGAELEMAEDPLFQPGAEYVLFLTDISGDAAHAPDRTLYRTVNPAGRYELRDGRAMSPGNFGAPMQRPTTAGELEAQLRQALR